jgi:hypothetical protein
LKVVKICSFFNNRFTKHFTRINEDGWDDANREDWYDENEVRIREIPER